MHRSRAEHPQQYISPSEINKRLSDTSREDIYLDLPPCLSAVLVPFSHSFIYLFRWRHILSKCSFGFCFCLFICLLFVSVFCCCCCCCYSCVFCSLFFFSFCVCVCVCARARARLSALCFSMDSYHMIHAFPFQIRQPRPKSKYNHVLCGLFFYCTFTFWCSKTSAVYWQLTFLLSLVLYNRSTCMSTSDDVSRVHVDVGAETTVSHSHVSARHCTHPPHSTPTPTRTSITIPRPSSPLFRRLSSCGEGRVLLSGSLWGVLTYNIIWNYWMSHVFLSSGLAFCARNMKHRQLWRHPHHRKVLKLHLTHWRRLIPCKTQTLKW